jgi:hypothetical protein
MNISQPFIRRPIATTMLMVGITLLGAVAYQQLPVASLPSVDSPTIQVIALYPGADPQTMASSVATPLERQFGEIAGLTQMTSSSGVGNTQIALQFALSRSAESAAQDVQTAINEAAGQLPKNMPSPPIFYKTNPADTPILLIAVTSDTLPLTKVDDYAESILAQKISQMPGVALVGIGGDVVVDSPDVSERIKAAVGQAELRLALDGVRGPATGVLAATLSPRGTLVSFAAMSLSPMSISPLDVIFKPVTMRGFYMAHPEFAAKLAPAAAQAAKMIASGRLHIPVAATYPLSSIKEAIARAQRGGKILLDVAGSST